MALKQRLALTCGGAGGNDGDDKRDVRWRPDGAGISYLQLEPKPEEEKEDDAQGDDDAGDGAQDRPRRGGRRGGGGAGSQDASADDEEGEDAGPGHYGLGLPADPAVVPVRERARKPLHVRSTPSPIPRAARRRAASSRAGNTTKVQIRVNPIAIVNSNPMLAVPR